VNVVSGILHTDVSWTLANISIATHGSCQLTSVASDLKLGNTCARSDAVKMKEVAIILGDVSPQAKNIMMVIILVDTLFT
jgi:hypothetical protein